MGPLGPEVIWYELARTVLRDPRCVIPPGLHLTAQGITSGPLWDRVTRSIMCMEGEEHRRLRSLVSKAFTPRATARMHDTIHTVVNELADTVADAGAATSSATSRGPTRFRSSARCSVRPGRTGNSSRDGRQRSSRSSASTSISSTKIPHVMSAWGELDAYVDDMVAERREKSDRRSSLQPHPCRERR